MVRRLTCIILVSALSLAAAPKELRLSTKTSRELNANATYREATRAMADQLPGIAAEKFRSLAASASLSDEAKIAAKLMLAEALVRNSARSGGDEQSAVEALTTLKDEKLAEFSTTIIWTAEALAVLGRYSEAETILGSLPATHPKFDEAQLARARILMALSRTTDATEILQSLAKKKNSPIKNTAALLAAEIAILSDKHEDATAFLELADAEDAATTKLKEYLNARLTLGEGKAAEATNLFQSLINAPYPLNERIVLACHLGLADAQAAAGNKPAAITTLQKFIEDYPKAYNLHAAFQRMIALLPDDLKEDDPIAIKLREWSLEKPLPSSPLIIPEADGSLGVTTTQPSIVEHPDLAALALLYRAKLLIRTKQAANLDRATALLTRLRSLNNLGFTSPSTLYLELFSASLLETASIQLMLKEPDMATFTLSMMEKITYSPKLKDQAILLRGEILADQGDYAASLEAFKLARLSSDNNIKDIATHNAGIMALRASNLTAFDQLLETSKQQKIHQALTLERALWKCYQGNTEGRVELDAFIMANPDHPRENEARLTLAAACVNTSPPDIELAKAQLEIISPRLTEENAQARIARIRIRAESLLQNWLAAAKTAEDFLAKFPDSPNAPRINILYAEAYYHNKDYNRARLVFRDFKTKYPENPLIPYADFYAAMAARLSGTEQSREECIAMFQKIIDSKHALAAEARIQQGRVLIDLRRYEQARKTLQPLLDKKNARPEEKLGAGVLMADCIQREGNIDPRKNQEAVNIYNDLLTIENLSPAWTHRLHYLRGQAYENMKQPALAFKSYYQVIIQGQAPEEEWFWFYRCGFKALAMLENDRRWEAAVRVAKRIESFKGPRAEEAAKRADDLSKKHMIWSEDKPANQP